MGGPPAPLLIVFAGAGERGGGGECVVVFLYWVVCWEEGDDMGRRWGGGWGVAK